MSFTINDLSTAISQALKWDVSKNKELLLQQAKVVIKKIYDFHNWKDFILFNNSLYTSTSEQYVDISTLTYEIGKIISLWIDEISIDNKLKRIDANLFNSEYTGLSTITYYCDNLYSDRIYFDIQPLTSQQLFIFYKKKLNNIASLSDDVSFSNDFENAVFVGLIESLAYYSNDTGKVKNDKTNEFITILEQLKLNETESIDFTQDYGYHEYNQELSDALNLGV